MFPDFISFLFLMNKRLTHRRSIKEIFKYLNYVGNQDVTSLDLAGLRFDNLAFV